MSLALSFHSRHFAVLLLISVFAAPSTWSVDDTVVSFGSCCKHNKPQPIWPVLATQEPDLFLWTGDAVYADTTNMNKMAEHYKKQMAVPGYADFAAKVAIDGTWDDHDYGKNNAGQEYPAKEPAQQLFLDFIGIPPDHVRRSRTGVYGTRIITKGDRSCKIILLDCRYHRDQPGSGGTILGEEQWQWLNSELTKKDHDFLIVVSGIQILPTDHPYEKWHQFPFERQRLLKALEQAPAQNIVLISGDRHIAEISQEKLPNGKLLYEITASGLTNTWTSFPGEPNSRRLGETFHYANHAGILRIDWQHKRFTGQIIDDVGNIGLAFTAAMQ